MTKPIDNSGKEQKKNIYIQGVMNVKQRFLILNLQDGLKQFQNSKTLALVTNKRAFAFPLVEVNYSKFDFGKKAVLYDISKPTRKEKVVLSDKLTKNGSNKMYIIPLENILSINNEEITMLSIGGKIKLIPTKQNLKKLKTMFKCIE